MAEWQKPIVLARDIFENQRAHGWVVRRAVARRPVRCEHITVDGDLLRYTVLQLLDNSNAHDAVII